MARSDPLKSYHAKRDFTRTAEPKGRLARARAKPVFVVQKHDASRLHYDFRLEIEGVLKSWAVPKGPSCDPAQRRLAVMTEDHPLDYARFEGTIPEGEYGGGTVMVWDIGTYRHLKEISLEKAIRQGRVEFALSGKKLRGGFVLVRTQSLGDPNWLLIKMRDEFAGPSRDPVADAPDSALTGRTLEEIAAGASRKRQKA